MSPTFFAYISYMIIMNFQVKENYDRKIFIFCVELSSNCQEFSFYPETAGNVEFFIRKSMDHVLLAVYHTLFRGFFTSGPQRGRGGSETDHGIFLHEK